MTPLLRNLAIVFGLGVVASLLGRFVSGLGTTLWWTALPWVLLAVFWFLLLRGARRQRKEGPPDQQTPIP